MAEAGGEEREGQDEGREHCKHLIFRAVQELLMQTTNTLLPKLHRPMSSRFHEI